MQEWWDWDVFGPYKYRNHHYPNNIPIFVSDLSLFMQEWWDWDVLVPTSTATTTTPTISQFTVSDLSLFMQEWWDWDGFGPYKYRHHHYPNNILLYLT